MKKTLAFLLILTMLLALCACGKAPESAPAPTAAPAAAPAATEAPAPAPATQAPAATEAPAPVQAPQAAENAESPNALIGEQLEFIAARFNMFRQNDAEGTWYYTVTDLDHNGRLELMANVKSETGGAPKLKVWEISPNGTTMLLCTMRTVEAPFDVDEEDLRVDCFILNMRSDSVDTHYDKETDTYYYTVVNAVQTNHFYVPGQEATEANWVDGNGLAVMTGIQAVSMKNGAVDPGFVLGNCTSYSVNGSDMQVLCQDGKGAQISMDEYLNLMQNSFPELPGFNTAFDWFTADEAVTLGRFVESYATFDGVRDPDHPENGISLLSSQASGGVYITKNPTDEKLNVGETAEFMAGANIWDKVTWTFIAPDGKTYNEQEFVKNCGGIPEGTDTGTLKIKDVNTDMSGWGVFATFDYLNSSARTSTAYFYVWGHSGNPKLDNFYATKPYLTSSSWTCPVCGAQAYGSQCKACGFNPVSYYAIYTGSNPSNYGWYYGVNPQTPVSSLTPAPLSTHFGWTCPVCGDGNQDVLVCGVCGYRYGEPTSSNNIAANQAREAAMGATLIKCQYCGNYFNSDYDVCPYCRMAPGSTVYTGTPQSSYDQIQQNTIREMYQGATLRTCQYCGNYFNADYDVCPYCHNAPDDGTYYGSSYDNSSNSGTYYESSGYSGGSHPDGSLVGYTKGGNPMFVRHNDDGSEYNTIFCPNCGQEHSMATACPKCGSGYY